MIHRKFRHYKKKHQIKAGNDYLVMKLSEELGEFVQAYIISKKQCAKQKRLTDRKAIANLTEELADVASLTMVFTQENDLDLEKIFKKKWIDTTPKGFK